MEDRLIKGLSDRARVYPAYPAPYTRSILWDTDFVETVLPFTSTITLASAANSGGNGVPGYRRHILSTVAGAVADASTQTALDIFANAVFHFRARWRAVTLSSGAEQFVERFGFGDSNIADNTDGVYFEIDSAIGSQPSIKTAAAGVRTTVTGGPVIVANQFADYYFRATSTEVSAYVNGSLVGTITTNIPSGANAFGFQWTTLKLVGNLARETHMDYTAATIEFQTPRGVVFESF